MHMKPKRFPSTCKNRRALIEDMHMKPQRFPLVCTRNRRVQLCLQVSLLAVRAFRQHKPGLPLVPTAVPTQAVSQNVQQVSHHTPGAMSLCAAKLSACTCYKAQCHGMASDSSRVHQHADLPEQTFDVSAVYPKLNSPHTHTATMLCTGTAF